MRIECRVCRYKQQEVRVMLYPPNNGTKTKENRKHTLWLINNIFSYLLFDYQAFSPRALDYSCLVSPLSCIHTNLRLCLHVCTHYLFYMYILSFSNGNNVLINKLFLFFFPYEDPTPFQFSLFLPLSRFLSFFTPLSYFSPPPLLKKYRIANDHLN